jgi:DNA-binding transcriptional ArsR family regulator
VLQAPLDDPVSVAARLNAQADALDVRVRALRCQASDLSYEAMELRTQAERMLRAPVTITRRPETHEALQQRVLGVLTDAGALSISDLADHLGTVSHSRLRQALATLEEAGLVRRTGIKRGTRYAAVDANADADAGAADTPDNVREFQSYETMVRDAAVKLDTFGLVDLQRELPDLSEGTIRRWLRRLEERGIVTAERIGVTKVYAYVPPENNAPASRPRTETPEKAATRLAPDVFASRRRGDVTSGRHTRVGSSIVNALIREVRGLDNAVTVKRTAHKIAFMRDGVEIAHCSSTPGASSLKQSRAALRKAGIPVGG